ncbi:Muscle-specific protein 20 [Nosema bombycis CQ1]|uniref:Muscle-specific protein 20 n=1 Tax=Nosema bombycis (strain CQ1 / CVCC 102059) TaxID=578461 RepID=R0MQ47_NOSB1|nr:Muscle-specific protein 20 [Nosema bombycis CQ1]|eukprot:EOB14988.1 Muscle-specific protein 20 [Nosema bombycis CQ1]
MSENFQEVIDWISILLNENFKGQSFSEILKSGVVLCKLLKVVSKIDVKFRESNQNFVQRENICAFINGLKTLGLNEYELFQTVDLYEEKNLKQVAITLYALSRQLQKNNTFPGPFIGPPLAKKNKIEFSKEVLDKGSYGFNLQYGYDPTYDKVMEEEMAKKSKENKINKD